MRLPLQIIVALTIGMVSASPFDGIWDKISGSMTGFFDKFKNPIDFVRNQTVESWNALTLDDYKALGASRIKTIEGSSLIPENAKNLMRLVINDNITMQDIIDKIRDNDATTKFELSSLFEKITSPESWTVANITTLGNGIFNLPDSFLLRCQDMEALKKMKEMVDSKASISNEDQQRFKDLKKELFVKINGLPSQWTNETFKSINDLKEIPMDMLKMVPSNVIVSRITELDILATSSPSNSKRMYYETVLDALQLKKAEGLEQAQEILSKIRDRSYLIPEDFSKEILNEKDIQDLVSRNIEAKITSKKLLSPMEVNIVMESMTMYPNLTSIADLRDKDIQIEMLGLALPSGFKNAAENGVFNKDQLNTIYEALNNTKSLGRDAKIDTMVSMINKSLSNLDVNSHTFRIYPADVIRQMKYSIIKKFDSSTAQVLLKKEDLKLDKNMMSLLLSKLNPDDIKDLSKEARQSASVIETISKIDISLFRSHLIKDLPTGTPVTFQVLEKEMSSKSKLDPNDVELMKAFLPYFGAAEAKKIDNSTILEFLAKMKDTNPSFSGCLVLKDKMVNYTRMIMRSRYSSPLQAISGPNAENVPVCVIGALGGNEISKMDRTEKWILLERFGEIANSELSILRQTRMAIVREGLAALRSGTGIKPGDLQCIGHAIADIPAKELKNADTSVAYDILMKFTGKILRESRKPCLSMDQKSAIGDLIKKVKMGGPSEWTSIDDVCCLLYTLPFRDLERIKPEVIVSCDCESAPLSPSNKIMEDLCEIDLGSVDYMSRKDDDMKLDRLRRTASVKVLDNLEIKMDVDEQDSDTEDDDTENSNTMKDEMYMKEIKICDKAAFGGADAFDTYELRNLNISIFCSCVENFGKIDMTQDRAEILTGKVLKCTEKINTLTALEVENLGYIIKGFSRRDIESLPKFERNQFDDVVTMLGRLTGLSTEQKRALVNKITGWSNPSDMTVDELHMVNRLFCDFDSTELRIKEETFKGSIGLLVSLEECPKDPILNKLAPLAVKVYGETETWGKAKVAEVGQIVLGLRPEEFDKIDCEAMAGISASTVKKFTSDYINVLNAEDISNMAPSAALAFTDNQKMNFTVAMRLALENKKIAAQPSKATESKSELLMILFTSLLGIFITLREV